MDTSDNQNSHHSHALPQENRQNMLAHEIHVLNQNNIYINIFQRHAVNFRRAIIQKDRKKLIETTKTIRLGLSDSANPPAGDFLETGLISDIVKLLDPDDKINVDLQFELIWIISNALTASEEQTAKIVTNRLIERVLRFIWHPKQYIVEQAFWVIANLSGDSIALKNKLLQFDVLGTIGKFLKKCKNCSTKQNIEVIAWIFSNFSLIPESHEQLFEYGLFKIVEKFLCQNDEKICSYACWTYSHITNQGNEKLIAAMLTPKFMSRIIKLLECKNEDILRPAIRTVGNILSLSSPYAIKMYSAGCLAGLEASIQHRKPTIRKEAIWAISNLVTEPTLIAEIIERPLFAKLINSIIIDVNPIKIEAVICFVNALSVANQNQVESLIKLGLIKALPTILSNTKTDAIMAGLEALGIILQIGAQAELPQNPYLSILEGEGITKLIEKLQYHSDDAIYRKASGIIETYFEAD